MLPLLTTLSVITSWYGPGFHGRVTASGERYNQNGLTAAHKTLPFGTHLRVCFNRCAVVRVTDRGPYIHGREIDLSKGAADAIGLTASGVGRVSVTRLN
jgi:rare lipoprotein A